ncbi:putative oxidoreductase [Ruminiclostridium sufflavum DSM 19573]|uniref:Putative oxidoreductase n=1 Tax=Ruminiclostridium sufflavum DSM 19573 TaxID=1121337 RepID=A0A318Y797_9FIRM|nr:aldo/keto reductase [Ruminiclostridium sufflavum]PYG88001.1 putative oxidoreductase [Ruminiclostridium sufflavum DSM 19573]
METVKVGNNLEFSRLVQGFWRLADWKFSTKDLIEFMEACADRGVTTFDTAEIYSDTECERQMGAAFKDKPGFREKIQLVTKTGIFKKKIENDMFGYYDTSYDRIIESCKESIKRLQCGYIDLYLIHREDPCFDAWETARALKDLKKQGLVREVGVSNFDPFKFDALNTAMDGALVTNQIEWNPVCFEHFNSGMMDNLVKNKIHPMIWSPLAGGRIFSSDDPECVKAMEGFKEIANRHGEEIETIIYAWLMYHPVKAMPISGSNKLERLDLAIRALQEVKLERWEWYKLYTASGQQVLR